ncbi:MAG: UvrD-helicase domain-containing protein [Synergistaceae bacterium]|nr:UvrD-helicase domain-containing protein [Synergistaceae bacterium]
MTDDKVRGSSWCDAITGLPEQMDAITSTASLTVVSAGAGTGKTQTLSQRFAWLLANDPECRVDQILVLTFTEKAAREMQSRIRETIIDWHRCYPEELSHLSVSIRFIEDAYISTIHSFAMKIIRESGLVLNLDPEAVIVPAPKEEVWWNDFSSALGSVSEVQLLSLLSDEWKARAEELFADENFSDFVNSYSPAKLAEAAKDAAETLGSCGRNPEDLWDQSMELLLQDVAEKQGIFRGIWDLWQENVFPAVREFLYSKPDKSFEKLRDIAIEFSGKEPTNENIEEFARLLLFEGLAKLPGNSKQKAAIEDALQSKLKSWRDDTAKDVLMATIPSERENVLLSLLNRTCSIGWQCWESLRHRDGILSHNDLIRYAGDVLLKTPEYGTKFRHILIDEFQDTDGLQDNLIRALWREGVNTLFVVGDLKQSIYRFRHADLSIFQRYIDMAKQSEDKYYKYITLDKSFRTRNALIERFNSIFGEIWKRGLEEGTSMIYEPLAGPVSVPWWERRNEEVIEPVMEVLLSIETREFDPSRKNNKWASVEKKADIRIRLFKELAAKITEMHENGVKVWDKTIKEEYKFRSVRWKDIAVLVPTRTLYPVLERAFESSGVPYVLCTSKDYFSRGEVADIINLISLLAEPENPLYLAGWLASPFSGVEPDDVQKYILSADRIRRTMEPISLADVLRAEAPAVWEGIMRLKKFAELRGVGDAILEIQKTPAYLKAFDPEQRRRVNANLSSLADLAAEYEMSQGSTLLGCAEYLQFAVSEARQKEEPDVTDEDQDAVNILTIHSSKGLEYPIVAVAGIEDAVRLSAGINISVRYGVVTSKLPDFMMEAEEKEVRTVSGTWYAEKEKKSALAEKERLWYVAVTRARDRLLLCGTAYRDGRTCDILPPDETSFLGQVTAANGSERKMCDIVYFERGEESTFPYKKAKVREEGNILLKLKTVSPAKLARISASAYAMLSWCPTAYRIAYRQGRDMQWTLKGGEGSSGAEFGSLAHWILSRWDFKEETIPLWLPQSDSPYFESALRKVPFDLRHEFKSNKTRRELGAILGEYALSTEGTSLAGLMVGPGSKLIMRETPFRVQDGDLLLVGATDIFWEDINGIHVRDWKTTSEEIAPSEYYVRQLLFYCYAIWKFRQKGKIETASIEAAINYLRPSGSKKEPIFLTTDRFNEEGSRIHKAAEAALSGKFIKNNEHCGTCPWRAYCGK